MIAPNVTKWLRQNLHPELAACTISALSPLMCWAYTECLHCPGRTPQRKQRMSSCGVSGCLPFDDVLCRALNPWPINIRNEHHQLTIWSQAPWNSRTLQRRPHSGLAYVTHKSDVPPQISMSFKNFQTTACFSNEKKVNGLWEVNVSSCFSPKKENHTPSNIFSTWNL